MDIIKKQLGISKSSVYKDDDGKPTLLTPSRFHPVRAGYANTLSLDGTWRIRRWPFGDEQCFGAQADAPRSPALSLPVELPRNDAELAYASPDFSDDKWESCSMPGKALYADPEENPANVAKWNRVSLNHLADEDGAFLRRRMKIPGSWKGKRIFLRFDAVYPAASFFCNGKHLGDHTCGLTPVEFDVTGCAVPGKDALVALRLFRKHRYVQMDMVHQTMEFAGISQDAFFFAVEPVHVMDHSLIASLGPDLKNGMISGGIDVMNAGTESADVKLSVLLRPANSADHEAEWNGAAVVAPGGSKSVELRLDIVGPRLWNDENPNLYEVEIRLDVQGRPRQTLSYRTGFRRFELGPQGPRLNGHPVKFRGVNHLTYHPEGGMYSPRDWLRRNLELMKKANVNTIRAHYTTPLDLVDLCDEMGFYLIQEIPIDWGQDYLHDFDTVGPVLNRIEGVVRRDRHHVSLMVWGVGNENLPRNMKEYGPFRRHLNLFDKFVKTLDPSRPTMFPPPGPANKIQGVLEMRTGDIADIHYSFNLIREFNEKNVIENPLTWEMDTETVTREDALAKGWSGVWFSSEYGISDLRPDLLNAPYVSLISDTPEELLSGKNTLQVFHDRLAREWGYMRDDPTCLGGAFYPWICSGTGNNPWGWVRWGEDANWGVVAADLTVKPQFWSMRVLFSPVRFPDRIQWRGEKEIRFEITNGYNSFDLAQCTLRTMMRDGGKWMTCTRAWKDIPIACPPGETRSVSIPIWDEDAMRSLEAGTAIACRCIFLDPKGFSPVTADILVVPEAKGSIESSMPFGPDAVIGKES